MYQRRNLRCESLEQRLMLTAEAGTYQPGNGGGVSSWFLDLNQDTDVEIDLSFGLASHTPAPGRWLSDGFTYPGTVLDTGSGLLSWFLDQDGDATAEQTVSFGLSGDTTIVGDWDSDGTDEIGVVRTIGGVLTYLLDLDFDPDAELTVPVTFGQAGDIPFVADWDGNGVQTVGLARREADGFLHWYLDLDGITSTFETTFIFGLSTDTPVIGDWNDNGATNVGAVRPDGGLLRWNLDLDQDPTAEDTFHFGLPGQTPVVGNWRFSEIQITAAGQGEIFSGLGSVDFGDAQPGQSLVRSFTITNTGSRTLSITSSSSSANFQISGLGASIAPGGIDNFTVTYSGTAPGTINQSISIGSNDPNESSFEINVTADQLFAEAGVELVGGGNIADGQAAPVDFGPRGVGLPGPAQTFRVTNSGTGNLSLSNLSVSGSFVISAGLPASLGSGQSAEFTVQMTTAGPVGARNGQVSFNTNDANENPFNFPVTGQVIELNNLAGSAGAYQLAAGAGVSTWFLDLDEDTDFEIDLDFGLSNHVPVAGRWRDDGFSYPGTVVDTGAGLTWFLDQDGDSTAEIVTDFGLSGDTPIVGDWDSDGTDEIGVVRTIAGVPTYLLDLDFDPAAELTVPVSFAQAGDAFFVGDWDGNGVQTVGVARTLPDGFQHWFLDLDGNASAFESTFIFGLSGDTPIVGDWDDNGTSNVGSVRVDGGLLRWFQDTNFDPNPENSFLFGLPSHNPVVGNWRFPEIRLAADGFGEVFDDFSTIDLGSFAQGETGQQQLTVTNTGSLPLTLSGSGSTGFNVVGLAPVLQPGESDDFLVEFIGPGSGVNSADITLATNDDTEAFFTFAVEATRDAPDLQVQVNGVIVENGDPPFSFGFLALDGPDAIATVTLLNQGSAALPLSGFSVSGDAVILDETPGELSPGQNATFRIQLDTSSLGFKSGAVEFNIAIAGDYNADGVVDAQDYLLWRSSFGSTMALAADGNSDGVIDAADYTVWRDNLGATFDCFCENPFRLAFDGDVTELEVVDNLIGVVRRSEFPGLPLNTWLLDTDGDPQHEIDLSFGFLTDIPVSGRWTNGSQSFPGVVREGDNGLLQWLLDTNGDPLEDLQFDFGFPGDQPIVGDWDTDGVDEIGVVREFDGVPTLLLNLNDDSAAELTLPVTFGQSGDIPFVSDWDGNGIETVALVRREAGGLHWYFDLDGDTSTFERDFIFGSSGDTPVVGDWDSDGIANVGSVRGAGQDLQWFFDLDNNSTPDSSRLFGRLGDIPVVGTWSSPDVMVDAGGVSIGINQRFDFGTHPLGTNPEQTFVVSNTGNEPLDIGPASIGPGFTIIEQLAATTLAPGESDQLTVRYVATSLGVSDAQVSFATSDGNENPFNFIVSGRRPTPDIAIAFSGNIEDGSGVIDLGAVLQGSSLPSQVFTVANTGDADLVLGTVMLTPSDLSLTADQASGATLSPGGSTATFALDLDTTSIGVVSTTVSLSSNDPDESPFTFEVRAEIVEPVPDIDVFTAFGPEVEIFDNQGPAIDLGEFTLGSAASPRSFTVQNNGVVDLNVTSITVTGRFEIVPIDNQVIPPSGDASFAVRPLTPVLGDQQGIVTIVSNDLPESPFTFMVTSEIQAVAVPEIEVVFEDPMSGDVALNANGTPTVDFGSFEIGDPTSARRVRITNTGNGTLVVSAISESSPHFSVSQAGFVGPTQISPGGSKSFTVTASSSVAGLHSTPITITNNDPDESSFLINVRSNVTEPVVDPPTGSDIFFSLSSTQGAFADEDIIRATPDEGSFTLSKYFDGGDNGLTTNQEDIDAFTILPNGDILISTVGQAQVGQFGNVIAQPNDLLLFDVSEQSWSLPFSGLRNGLPVGSNIDAVEQIGTDLFISLSDNVTFPVVAQEEDILRFSNGNWSLHFDASVNGFFSGNTDAYSSNAGVNFLSSESFVGTIPGLSVFPQQVVSFSGSVAPVTWGSIVFDAGDFGFSANNIDGVSVRSTLAFGAQAFVVAANDAFANAVGAQGLFSIPDAAKALAFLEFGKGLSPLRSVNVLSSTQQELLLLDAISAAQPEYSDFSDAPLLSKGTETVNSNSGDSYDDLVDTLFGSDDFGRLEL